MVPSQVNPSPAKPDRQEQVTPLPGDKAFKVNGEEKAHYKL